MIIPRCPKCGRPMALYTYYAHGNPIVGWQCGYDNFDTLMGYKVTVTNCTEIAKRKGVSDETVSKRNAKL